MNRVDDSTNDALCSEPPPRAAEPPPAIDPRPATVEISLASASDGPGSNRGRRVLRRVASWVIPFMFVAQITNLTVMRLVRFPDEGLDGLPPRAIVTMLGILFGFGMLTVQRMSRRAQLFRRTLMALGLGVLGAVWHTLCNLFVFTAWFPKEEYNLAMYVPSFFDWLWFYTAVSLMILALTYVADLADREEEIVALRAHADASKLRALRYQLNPHFLFNTLNAIASLITRSRNSEAESMVVSLSDFLRSTLRIDPHSEIALGEEIALQSLYLDIERARFPHRLRITIDVPEGLRDVLVPNLILQPLVENAIKHGVARSAKPVHVELIAREGVGRLAIEVRDDGGDAPTPDGNGANVGLRNVAERLALHFADRARFDAGPRPGGGFSARLLIPLTRAR